MTGDVITTVRECKSFSKTRGTLMHNQKKLHILPPVEPLEFVTVYLLGTLPTTKRDQKHVLVITGRYYTLSRMVTMGKMQVPQSS